MNAHESVDFLTPLRPERLDAITPSDWERMTAGDYGSSGYPGLEDVGGAARMDDDESVVISDMPVTVIGRKGVRR